MTREEAINEIKSWDFLEGKEIEAIHTLIPELAESEDEKIRKEIISIVKEYGRICEKEGDPCCTISDCLAYLEKKEELPFVKDVVLGYPGHYFYDGERMHFCGPVMEEKQKEPHYTKRNELFDKCVENCDPEVMKEVSDKVDEMLQKEQEPESCEPDTNVEKVIEDVIRVYGKTQGEWVGGYDVDALIVNLRRAFNKKEQKPELPLMGGDTDTYFDDLRITTKSLTSREWFNEGIKYAQRLQKEQHPSSRFLPGDWAVYDGPLGHAILQVEDVLEGRYTFVDNDSTLLVEDSDKFLRPLTPKDVEELRRRGYKGTITKVQEVEL